MKKDNLITRLCELLDVIEETEQNNFNDAEIEDLISEARIPISRSGRNEK